jgi:hypothetical protein
MVSHSKAKKTLKACVSKMLVRKLRHDGWMDGWMIGWFDLATLHEL